MNCILKTCAHVKQEACKALGECGAAYALAKSCSADGYEVHSRENPTISALLRAGLIEHVSASGGKMIVRTRSARKAVT